jgi:hypothetical protein
MLKIKEKLTYIEADLKQLDVAVKHAESSLNNRQEDQLKRVNIEQELQDLRDAILDVEAQLTRKTCYIS